MTLDTEQLRNQIPFYLTAQPAQKEFVHNLDALNRGAVAGYYISAAREPNAESMLQGDVWRGFQIYSFDTGEKRAVRGIVLSNSCDISEENDRVIAQKIVFAPIVKLSAIEARLKGLDLAEESVDGKIAAMRSQSITNIFYLPAGGPLGEDYVAFLDDIHSMPVASHAGEEKLFTLSMAGFWLFAFKLSVHFCRLRENVDRRPEDQVV
ncbi:MAG: hypothetical protein GY761_19770 [Hyphomicrobiales bacterium]|nr:hypothetical protein [Hyphomicrobiales bacterium]